jgi:hypothetical protein
MSTPNPNAGRQPAPEAYHLGGPGTKYSDWRGLMFSVQFKTSNRVAYPYAYVARIDFNKSGKLVIGMPVEEIVIEGIHLTKLYYALLDNQVREIVESDPKYQTAPKGEAFIHKIEVTKNEGPKE